MNDERSFVLGVANKLNIPDAELTTSQELLDIIEATNREIHQLLVEMILATRDVNARAQALREIKKSSEADEEFVKRVAHRNKMRENLIQRLKVLTQKGQ